jgi:lambda family phage portal protein
MAVKPEFNFLDRAIEAVSPRWALNRLRDRTAMALAGGYFGGSRRSRPGLTNWNPGVADADGDISPDLVDLRAYSRDLARTSALAGGAINTVVTNVVGTGLALQPAPDADFLGLTEEEAKAWIADVSREWKLWAESTACDITRTQNIYGLQSLAFRSALESGDVFAIPTMSGKSDPYRLALQIIEADRVCNPEWKSDAERLVQGVELDESGAPKTYHVASRHPGARNRAGMTWTPVPAFGAQTNRRNMLHLFDRRRPGQTRGVPYLASVIEPLKQLKRYSEAEISAAVISAAFAVFVKMDPEAFDSLFETSDANTYINSATKWDGTVPTANMDNPGKAVNLLPGESIDAPALGRPNAQFDPFVMAVLRQIGVGLELPFEVLIKHFTASYSAARAALLDAWRFFRGRRDWMVTVFCQPVYELWLEEAVALGRIRAPGFFADPAYRRAWCAAVWTGDGPGSIDPLKEADAARERIANGTSTLAAESILHDGVDWETKHRQRVREVTARREAGLEEQGATAPAKADAAAPPAARIYPSDGQS